jgi:hypothetical protein
MSHFADPRSSAGRAISACPVCSNCRAPMWLTRIEPDTPGFARRTLECPRCHKVISEVMELEKYAS